MPFVDLGPDLVWQIVTLQVASGLFSAAARVCKTSRMAHTLSREICNQVAQHFLEHEPGFMHNGPFYGRYFLFLELRGGVQIVSKSEDVSSSRPACYCHCPAGYLHFHCAFGCLVAKVTSSSEPLPWSSPLQLRVVDKLVSVLAGCPQKWWAAAMQLFVHLYDTDSCVLWEGVVVRLQADSSAPASTVFCSDAPPKLVYGASNVCVNALGAASAEVMSLGGHKLCHSSRVGLLSPDKEVANEAPVVFAKELQLPFSWLLVFDPARLTDGEPSKEARHWGL